MSVFLKAYLRKVSEKGSSNVFIILILALISVASFVFINGAPSSKTKTPADTRTQYRIDDDDSAIPEAEKELQLRTMKFVTLPPPQTGFTCGAVGSDARGDLSKTGEPSILWAVDPEPGGVVGTSGKIKLWYRDEWPLTLGSGSISKWSSPGHVVSPNVGDETKKDRRGFPFFPAVFISDITDDPNNSSGDGQNGGTPHKPDEIWGTWKALGGNTIGGYCTKIPCNYPNLPSGADPFPSTSNTGQKQIKFEDKHVSEIIWNVSNLGLTQGRRYRIQYVIHDGDQEGDLGVGCATVTY